MATDKLYIAIIVTCCVIGHVIGATGVPSIQSTKVVVPPIHPGAPEKVCNGSESDIIFVLDSSGSVGMQNFTVMKEFVKAIVNNLEIGPTANHIGVITFSQYPFLRIDLTHYMDKQTLLNAIDTVPYISGITETHLALELMRREGFMTARPNVPHTAIVMTDGKSFNEYKTLTTAQKAHSEGITMFAVGIGSAIKQQELNNIATDPDASHVFTVTDFNALTTIVNQISAKTCTVKVPTNIPVTTQVTTKGPTVVIPTGQTSEKCNQTVADLVFILDSSGSVGYDNFNVLKQFVMKIVVALDIGDQYTKVGVITFADYPSLRIPLGKFNDKSSLLSAIGGIPYIPGITETDKALEMLMKEGYNGGRVNAPNVAIIITDGLSTNPEYTKTTAQDVKRAGIYISSVGIGNDTSRTELNELASQPGPGHVFQVQNFTELTSIVSGLSSSTCIKVDTITTAVPPTMFTSVTPRSPSHTPMPSPASVSPTMLQTNESCNGRAADIFFILDASGSVSTNDFNMTKGFVNTMIDLFHIDSSNVRVGLIAFSSQPHMEFGLGEYNNTASLKTAVNNIVHYHGGTNTGVALELLRNNMIANDRPGVPKVGIILTDGISKDALSTSVQARLARENNITLIAIGIGKAYDVTELHTIASPDASGNGSYVFEVASFGLLNNITDLIAYIACGFSVILHNAMTPVMTTAPSVAMTDCKDTINNCPAYGQDICVDYKPWATAHCAYHCGFCQGPATVPPPCENTIANCHEYGTYICTSPDLIMWTRKHCRQYCGFCGNGTRPTEPSVGSTVLTQTPVCRNEIQNCEEYGGRNVCTNDEYRAWAQKHCREYCRFCTNYVDISGHKVGNITCPDWHLPKVCSLQPVTGSCCPLPVCPDGYKLSAVPVIQINP